MKHLAFILILSLNVFAGELESSFCEEDTYTFAFENLNLKKMSQDYWAISCWCNCTGDANPLTILEWKDTSRPIILLRISDTRSFQVLKESTNGLNNVEISTREMLQDGRYGKTIYDTLRFNGHEYKAKDYLNGTFTLESTSDPKLVEMVINKLSGKRFEKKVNSLKNDYNKFLLLYKTGKKKEAADSLLKSAGNPPYALTIDNVSIYNDLGFFLEQSKQYSKAIEVLAEVIKKFPERTVGWLNLGDAQKGLGKTSEAKESYKKYIDFMEKSGKGVKVPQRVRDFVM